VWAWYWRGVIDSAFNDLRTGRKDVSLGAGMEGCYSRCN
jgi:hypothetical protein